MRKRGVKSATGNKCNHVATSNKPASHQKRVVISKILMVVFDRLGLLHGPLNRANR
jgi:hypothetical protein